MINFTLLTTASIFGVVILMLITTVFIIAQLKADNSIMDVAYGPIYALAFWITWVATGMPVGIPILVGSLVTLWALRLGVRIGRKNWGKPEDARYAAWRTEWSQRGQLYFVVRSYLQVNLLQGIIIFVVATPLWLTLTLKSIPVSYVLILGALITLAGLLYETIADWQLDRFIAGKKAGTEPANVMTRGLFRYSRRPNYFGESLVWWGLAVTVLSNGLSGWFVLVSPLLITFILTRVTGPMLEAIFIEKYPDAYRDYMRQTNYFIPGPPRN
jgi:steroid 5-alpha reductase family enzyme